MKSIKEEVISNLIINKSEFINYLVPVSSVTEANEKLDFLRKKFKDANHHCFCYIIGNNQEIQKYSDDGEPSKTAGMPMIEVLKKHNLTNVLNVSIRYFGGIKLGAGGLVRAYTKSCSEGVKLSSSTTLVKLAEVEIIINFNDIGKVEKYLRDNFSLLNTSYSTHVHYTVEILFNDVDNLKDIITEYTKGNSNYIIIKEYDKYR